jgi:hypothetical protein
MRFDNIATISASAVGRPVEIPAYVAYRFKA